MLTQKIGFPDRQVPCAFPDEPSNLGQAISELQLDEGHPVIVLIGGDIDEHQADATQRAIQTIAGIAEDINAVVVCGGTNMGVMAEISKARWQNHYTFPLVGVTLKDLVSWTGGPRSTKFLWWGQKRWPLAQYYSHFILVPGSQFGDESPWIVDTATLISKDHHAVTILINGGEVSRKDITLSLEKGRRVIVLSRTGRLADELSRDPERHKLLTIVPANAKQRIVEAVQTALSVHERSVPIQTLIPA